MSSIEKSVAQDMRAIADSLDRGEMMVSCLSIDKDYIDLSTAESNEVGMFYNSIEVKFAPLVLMIDKEQAK